MRRAIPWAVTVAIAAVVQAICGHLLAGRDVVLAILVGDRVVTVALIVALLAARLFLFLLAPGWALYLAATLALERRLKARDRSPG